MNFKKGISACLIVRDEEQNLAVCLDSIRDYVDEIVIVDTGSKDKTIEIAKKYTNKIITTQWQNDFSLARNISLDNAEFEFILIIDADERIENPLKIQDIIVSTNKGVGGWLIDVVSEAVRKDGGKDFFVSKMLRFFRNDENVRFTGAIHEQVVQSIVKNNYHLSNSDLKIYHFGYAASDEQRIKKQKRNLEILDNSIRINPNDCNLLYHRAKTFLALSELDKAELDISKSIELNENDLVMAPQILNYGAVIAYRMSNYSSAIMRSQNSYNLMPDQSFANFILAEVFYETGNLKKSLEHYLLMNHAISNSSILAKISGDYHIKPSDLYFKIGKCFLLLDNFYDSLNYFNQGLVYEPNNVYLKVGKASAEFKIGNIQQAKTIIDNLSKYYPLDKRILAVYNDFYNNYKKTLSDNKTNIKFLQNPLISLSMIVKNEEKFLEECLQSVSDIVDEIIIVDTGSIDKTIDIAKKYTEKIFYFNWINDFSAARNESLKKCTGEWILYLDADERLIEGKTNLRYLLSSLPESVGALICTIESQHTKSDGSSELHSGSYPRIFRNYGYPKIFFLGKVHEQITQSIMSLNKDMILSDVVIKHLGYHQSVEVIQQKARRNYEMLMQQIKEDPTDGYTWYQLGQTLGHLKLPKQSEESIKFAIQCGNLSDTIYATASATLSQISGNDKRFKEALYWSEEALKNGEGFLYALNLKAYSLLYLYRYDDAVIYFNKALSVYDNKKGVLISGFDIKVPKEIIMQGLEMAQNRDNKLKIADLN